MNVVNSSGQMAARDMPIGSVIGTAGGILAACGTEQPQSVVNTVVADRILGNEPAGWVQGPDADASVAWIGLALGREFATVAGGE